MLSKFMGIRVVSGLKAKHRAAYLTGMILFAELTLILFGIFPSPYNFILFFFNGLSLGMIWGIVFSYLEGRKMTEIISIILFASFIVYSGADVQGAEHTWLAIIGPGISVRGEVNNEQLFTDQIAPTVAKILNLETDPVKMPAKPLEIE